MAATRISQSLSRRQAGAVAIEYAFVLPVLLLFVFGVMEVGRWFWLYTTVTRAAEAAARCAAVDTIHCGTPAATQNWAAQQAWGLRGAVSPADFTVTDVPGGPSIYYRCVTATYRFQSVIPQMDRVLSEIERIFFRRQHVALLNITKRACYPKGTPGT